MSPAETVVSLLAPLRGAALDVVLNIQYMENLAMMLDI